MAQYYYLIFVMRRMVFALSVYYFEAITIQMIIINFSTLLTVMFLIKAGPW